MAKIIVCDDNPMFLKAISVVISDMGYDVQCCEQGDDLIANLSQEFYDVAIIDLIMPRGGGVELMHRTKLASPNTKIVVCTGRVEMLASPIMEVGMKSADAKISKDMDPTDLHFMLETLIASDPV